MGDSIQLLLAVVLLGLASGCRLTDPKFTTKGPFNTNSAFVTPVDITNQIDPEWLVPPTNMFTLGPGDRVEVELLGDPGSRTITPVAPDGKIYFSLLPGIDVWGLTLGQARAALEEEYSKYVREQPQVSMVLRGVESKRVWLLGRVQVPGVYAISAPMTLLEALSMAGGTLGMASYRDQEAAGISEELADLRRSFVLREGKLLPVDFQRLLKEGDLSQNIYLEPDDFVYVPGSTAREIYVLGAVAQPRPVSFREGMSVAGAIAGAYGPLNGAYLSHVAVVRGSLTRPKIAIVDYKRVIRGEALDVGLEPGDIVYVPLSPYRYLIRYTEMILNTFVASAAINAGSHMVVQQPTGGAGIFIPVGSGIQVIPPVTPPPLP